jgi:predicted MFS family arabinose efflux permease
MTEPSTSTRRTTLLSVAAGNFVQLGCRLLVGAVVPLLLVHFETTRSAIGLALTGMWSVYALAQFPSGVLADRFGEHLVLMGALAATAGSIALLALAPSVAAFAVFVLALGMGAGLYFAPASTLATRLYDAQGEALGVLTASGAVAGVVFPAVGGVVGVRYGWRIAVGLGAATALGALALTAITVPRLPPENPDRSLHSVVDFDRHRRLLARPSVVYSVALGALVGFTFQAVSSFFPTFLVEYRGLTTGTAGIAFGAVWALSAVAQFGAGRLSDRYSRDIAIALSASISLAGIVTLLAVPSTAGLLAGVVLLGVGISWPGPIQARFFDQLQDTERGYGFGLLRTVYMLLASSGSVVVGVLADQGGWTAGMGSVLVVLSACLVLLGVNRWYSLGL